MAILLNLVKLQPSSTKISAHASISLDLNVSVEGAHAMSTGKMLHIRIVRGTKEYRYGSCRALMDWYEYL